MRPESAKPESETDGARLHVKWLRDDPGANARWDELVQRSWNGTFMHTRRFVGYHGDRFSDRSLVARDARGTLVGVLPAAEDPSDPTGVVSHPGLSYAGWVHAGALRGERMAVALRNAVERFRECGYSRFRYKAVPHFYHRVPSSDDAYALLGMGAHRYRCDITSLVDLASRPQPSARRRRCLRSARRSGVVAYRGWERVGELWGVLEQNLWVRHRTRPVHTEDEIRDLAGRFPEQIEIRYALLDDRVVAGIVLFHAGPTTHAQYLAASPGGFRVNALDLVVEESIACAAARGARYFDFGISTEEHGTRLNHGLYRFKNEFGAGSALCEFYELPL